MENQSAKTILLVDDDPAIRSLARLILQRSGGYKVIEATGGQMGLKLAHEYHPDLILCDIMMPDMDGYEVLREMRNSPDLAETLFIFATSKNLSIDIRLGMGSGADDYITKPYQPDELLSAVKARFDRQNLTQKRKVSETDTRNAVDVFLSYSRVDTLIMQRIRDDLRSEKLKIWVDDEGLEPGTPTWERAVGDAIRRSGCLVVILSPEAEQSIWVGRELAMAETLEKRIFPILVRGTDKDAIPFRLMSHQWIDARHDYKDALQKLLASLHKHLT